MTELVADVRLEGVSKRFDDVVAVDELSLEVEHGRFFALLGPSGCGKTTTLRMIGGFEEPDRGQHLPRRPRRCRAAAVQARRQHRVPVVRALSAPLDRRQRRLRSPAAACPQEPDQGPGRRHAAACRAGGIGHRKTRQLSGGQQQRVALARALVCRPRVLLLDEPLGALDLKLRKQMQLFLKRIQHELGITFIHVTHDQEEAMTMADTIAVMNGGRIEQLGPPRSSTNARGRRSWPGSSASRISLPALSRAPVRGAPRRRHGRRGGTRRPHRQVAVGRAPREDHARRRAARTASGDVAETAYIGVATQFVVKRPRAPCRSSPRTSTPARACRRRVPGHAQLEPRVHIRRRTAEEEEEQ